MMRSYLHSNLAVIDENLLDQEIGADSGFITGTELLVDLQGHRMVSVSSNALDETVGDLDG